MGFLTPAALGLLGLLGAVLALYMLRLRREAQDVPSLLLWRAVVQDPPASAPWQPPRRSLLLLLQLLALALLVLALARPFMPTDAPTGAHLVLLLDRSASMASVDVAPTRFEAARERLLRHIADAGDARVTVITFADRMEVLISGADDPAAVRAALADVAPSAAAGDATDALAFAAALAEGRRDVQVVLYSDGGLELDPAVLKTLPLRYEQVGRDGANQAITTASIGPGAAGGPPELFVGLTNLDGQSVTRRVTTDVDGALFDARDVTLTANGRAVFRLSLPPDAELAEVRLAGEDVLPLDDVAWAVRPAAGARRVLLLGRAGRFLETALGLLPGVASLARPAPGDPYPRADVAVIDGPPPERLPETPLLLVAPDRTLDGLEVVGGLTEPVPEVTAPADPLAVAGLADTAIARAVALQLGPSWTAVVSADVEGRRWPLVARGALAGRPAVVIAFDLRQSDLPLRPAFPLLVAAALDWLAPVHAAGVPPTVAPGDPVTLRPGPRVAAARVIGPNGESQPLEIADGRAVLADTETPGVYTVELETPEGVVRQPFAVTFAAFDESRVRPKALVSASVADGAAAAATTAPGRRELWWPLALLALVVLVAEWGYDHRAAVRRALQERTA